MYRTRDYVSTNSYIVFFTGTRHHFEPKNDHRATVDRDHEERGTLCIQPRDPIHTRGGVHRRADQADGDATGELVGRVHVEAVCVAGAADVQGRGGEGDSGVRRLRERAAGEVDHAGEADRAADAAGVWGGRAAPSVPSDSVGGGDGQQCFQGLFETRYRAFQTHQLYTDYIPKTT